MKSKDPPANKSSRVSSSHFAASWNHSQHYKKFANDKPAVANSMHLLSLRIASFSSCHTMTSWSLLRHLPLIFKIAIAALAKSFRRSKAGKMFFATLNFS